MKKHIKYRAMTLAEILIVIAIFGFIAILVVPRFMYNYEKLVIETNLKEAYSVLSKAVKMSEIDHGPVEKWPYDSFPRSEEGSKAFAQEYLTPYLKIVHECKWNDAKSPKCFAGEGPYREGKNSGWNGWYSSAGFPVSPWAGNAPLRAYQFMLENGMGVNVTNYVNSCHNYVKITVDIDGPGRGYSILGRDVFVFTLGCNKNRRAYPKITSGFGPGVEYMNCGGHGYFSGYTFEQVQASWSPCWTTANNFGAQNCGTAGGCGCAALIALDGWRITDRYRLDLIAKKPRKME